MPTAPLPQRIDSLTRPRLDKITADLDHLDSAIEDVRIARDELALPLDDWESTDDRQERAEAREAAHDQADELVYALHALIAAATTLTGPLDEPTAPTAPTAPSDSPLGLLATIYRSNYPVVAPSAEQQLAAIRQLRERLDEEEQQIAFNLRLHGATWERIADAVGLGSKQAAQQRFKAAGLLDKLDSLKGSI